VGIKPGEKLHEVLISVEEARHTVEMQDYFVIEPEFPWWNRHNLPMGRNFPTDLCTRVTQTLATINRGLSGDDV